MRTTMNIDDDVFAAVKGLAEVQKKTIGQLFSTLTRQSLDRCQQEPVIRNGIRLLPIQPGARPVTLEHVNRLRDELL